MASYYQRGIEAKFFGLFYRAEPRRRGGFRGEFKTMKKYLTFGGVLYVGIGAFLTLMIYLRGSDSAYTSDQNWFEALEVGLVWPWHVLKYMGVVA